MIALSLLALVSLVRSGTAQVDLTSAKVTEVKHSVIYQPEKAAERPAQVSDVLQGADVLRTGERSLAEIEFPDKTIARLGSKSVFSLSGGRDFRVGKGLTLISVPKGAGGGRIVTSAITAAIEGTTVIVQEIEIPGLKPGDPPRKVAKLIFLEGNGRLSSLDGKQSKRIREGEMAVQFADDRQLREPVLVDLKTLLEGAAIVHGFSRNLPTLSQLENTIKRQQAAMARGGLQVGGKATGLGEAALSDAGGDPPFRTPSVVNSSEAVCVDVGSGFFLCTVPMPGFTCAPADGGGFVCRQ